MRHQLVVRAESRFAGRRAVESSLERFAWSKETMARLDRQANDEQKFDLVSSCAHVFPAGQVDPFRAVYVDTRARRRKQKKDAPIASARLCGIV